jgi:hypothetical protein
MIYYILIYGIIHDTTFHIYIIMIYFKIYTTPTTLDVRPFQDESLLLPSPTVYTISIQYSTVYYSILVVFTFVVATAIFFGFCLLLWISMDFDLACFQTGSYLNNIYLNITSY